jgi:hypothetical protein
MKASARAQKKHLTERGKTRRQTTTPDGISGLLCQSSPGRQFYFAGPSGISWRILALVKKTHHRQRAGFEPQRALSFMKRVQVLLVLGEATRA